MTDFHMHGPALYCHAGEVDPAPLWDAKLVAENQLVQIPHNQYNLIALRAMGFNPPHFVDNPDVFVPEGSFKPEAYQLETARYVTSYKSAWILSAVGVGKTASAIWAAEALRATGEVITCVILCPLSTVHFVWVKELFNLYPNRSVGVVSGGKDTKLGVLSRAAQYYIVNHDGLRQDYILNALVEKNPQLVINDEATAMKNGNSSRYEALKTLLTETNARYWPLTATPSPQGPEDMYANQKLVCPDTVPSTLNAWKNTTMWRINNFKWVPRPQADDLVKRALWPAIRFERSDIPQLGKPIQLEAPMTAQQTKVFNQMKQEMAAEWQHANGDDRAALAANAADKVNKLLQIAQGNVYDITRQRVELENKPRLDVVLEFAEGAGVYHDTKMILFVPYIASMEQIHKYLNKKGLSAALVNGSTPKKERSRIFDQFQNDDGYRVLVAHPKVAAHGLTLTAASIVMWYGPIHSLELYIQGGGRVTRIGQKSDNLQLVQVGSHSLEWDVYKALDKRGDFQSAVLDMYTQIVGG